MKDLYKILQVSPSATRSQLKSAYYRQSKRNHPDLNPDASTTAFHDISEAWATLGDTAKRREYDIQTARKPQINNQYKRATYRETPGFANNSMFNHKEHFRAHYPSEYAEKYSPTEMKRNERVLKNLFYRERMDSNRRQGSLYLTSFAVGCLICALSSGWVQMIWM